MVRTCKAHPLASCPSSPCEGTCELLIATNGLDHFCPVKFNSLTGNSTKKSSAAFNQQHALDDLKNKIAVERKVHVLHFGPWPSNAELDAALSEWLDLAKLGALAAQNLFVHRHATWEEAVRAYASVEGVGSSSLAPRRAPIPLSTRRALNWRQFGVACGSTPRELALATLMPGYHDGACPWCGLEYPADLQVLKHRCEEHRHVCFADFDDKVKSCSRCVWWRWHQLAHVNADDKEDVTPVCRLPEGVEPLLFQSALSRLEGGLRAAIARSPRPQNPALLALLESDLERAARLTKSLEPLTKADREEALGHPLDEHRWWSQLPSSLDVGALVKPPGNISHCCIFCNQACGHQSESLLDEPWADHRRDKWEELGWRVGGPRREWWAQEAEQMGVLGLARVVYVRNINPARRANPRPWFENGVHYDLRPEGQVSPVRLARRFLLSDLVAEKGGPGPATGGRIPQASEEESDSEDSDESSSSSSSDDDESDDDGEANDPPPVPASAGRVRPPAGALRHLSLSLSNTPPPPLYFDMPPNTLLIIQHKVGAGSFCRRRRH